MCASQWQLNPSALNFASSLDPEKKTIGSDLGQNCLTDGILELPESLCLWFSSPPSFGGLQLHVHILYLH